LAKLEIGAERWEAAEELLRQALAEYQREQRRSGQAEALSLMGEVAKGRRNMPEAERSFREAIALSVKASTPSIEIASQTGLARIHLILQRPGKARALYEKAFTLAVQADLKAEQADVLMGEGWVEYDTENLKGAKEKFGQAFETYSGAQDLVGQAEARIGEASAERVLGNLDRAVDLSGEAVDLAERSGKMSLRIDAERAYAVTVGEAGRAEEALRMFQSRPLKESPEDAGILGGLGWSLYVLGRYEESIKASSVGYSRDPSQVWILRNLGLAYLANGDPAKAKQTYQDALQKTRLEDALSDAIRDVERLLERHPDTQGGHDVLVMLRQWTPPDESLY
jgi:tetratricopeptide (TPR) repeat protein